MRFFRFTSGSDFLHPVLIQWWPKDFISHSIFPSLSLALNLHHSFNVADYKLRTGIRPLGIVGVAAAERLLPGVRGFPVVPYKRPGPSCHPVTNGLQ